MDGIELVHLSPNAAGSNRLTAGVICPNCYQPLREFAMFGPSKLPDGTLRRGYLGHCVRCSMDCEVEQFYAMGVWPMSGYRLNRGKWVLLQQPMATEEVPVDIDPPVMTGTGGEYLHGYVPAAVPLTPYLKRVESIVVCLLDALREMIHIDEQSNG